MNQRNRFIKLAKLEADPVPNKRVKVSELSEGLRKEVKALLKEGKAQMSQFPEEVKKKIRSEMAMPKLSSGIRGFNDKEGNFVPTGASMGRGDRLPVDKTIPIAFEIESIMDRRDKGYDKSGAYWGHVQGNPVYRAYAELNEPVEFERSFENEDVVELFFRAKSKAAARKHIKSMFPNATFISSNEPGEVAQGTVDESISTIADGKPFQMYFTDKNGNSKSVGSNSREELEHYAEMLGLKEFRIETPEGTSDESASIHENVKEKKMLIHICNDDNGNKVFQQEGTEKYYVMCDGDMYRAGDDVYFEPMYKVDFPFEVIGANFDE